MFKFKLKFILASVLINFLNIFRRTKNQNNNCVLLYHSIVNDKERIDTLDKISFSNFKNQCMFLKKNYRDRITTLNENLKSRGKISISFDDGYKSILRYVMPVIEEYKIPIIIFICPKLIGKKNYLTLDELNILIESELVEIGIHGFNHIYYGKEDLNKFKTDLNNSLSWFNKNLKLKDLKFFSFPFGSFNKELISYLKNSTKIKFCFNSSFSTFNIFSENNFCIPRISIWNSDTNKTFEQKIDTKWDIIKKYVKSNET